MNLPGFLDDMKDVTYKQSQMKRRDNGGTCVRRILTTIEYVISELAVFGLSRSIACIPRNTVTPTGVNSSTSRWYGVFWNSGA